MDSPGLIVLASYLAGVVVWVITMFTAALLHIPKLDPTRWEKEKPSHIFSWEEDKGPQYVSLVATIFLCAPLWPLVLLVAIAELSGKAIMITCKFIAAQYKNFEKTLNKIFDSTRPTS